MKKIAILMDNMFEDSEFIYPYYRLIEEGFEVDVIALQKGELRGKKGTTAKANLSISEVKSIDYAAVYIPGGHSPDRLRGDSGFLDFVKDIHKRGKTLCAVCHGPLLLLSAKIINGKKVTAYYKTKEEFLNSQAIFTGRSVEKDNNIITATDPKAMPEMIKLFLASLKES